jgi:CBS domain-containing protein
MKTRTGISGVVSKLEATRPLPQLSRMTDGKSTPRRNWLRESPEVRAAVLAVLSLVVGLGVLWVAQEALGLRGDAVLVSLLVLPALLYLALSGRLTEITGPGEVSVKFREVAAKPARASAQTLTPEDVRMVQKGSLDELRMLSPVLAHDDRPIVFTFALGTRHRYVYAAVLSYVDALAAVTRFLAVIFHDPDGRLLGYMPAMRFVALMRSEAGQQFVRDLRGPFQGLTTVPGMSTETLPAGSSNSEALEVMTRRGLDILALVDDAGRFKGIVERNRLISDLLLAVTP